MVPEAASIPELIVWSTDTHGDDVAVRDGDVTLTYRELRERVDTAARAIVDSGVQPGDTVSVWAPNCWQWVVAGLAVSRAGAILVPVNTRLKGPEAAYILGKARVRLLFVVDGFLEMDYSGSLAGEDLPALTEIVDLVAGSESSTDFAEFTGRVAADRRAELQAEVDARSEAVKPDDIALIMFTSGTTGHPKGVLVRGGVVIRAFWGYSQALTVGRGDPYLLVNPYFHAFGYNSGIIICLLHGAINLPVAVYEPGEVLALIERERVAVFPGPPSLFQGLLNHPDLDDYDISSLRACVTGAAAIPVDLVVAMRERLGFETILTAYGMTETSGLASHTRPGDPADLVASTSGCAIPDVELRIAADDGTNAPIGEAGELLVRGYQVTPGYLDDQEQTDEAIDTDGWLHTGDVATMNAEGYIDITDRMKDMFIVGGFNAYPAEIERQLTEHPEIGMASVIGIPDERLGEVGAAFVVATPSGAPDEAAIVAWCRERMANYKVPRRVWFVDDLPMNASNKVKKQDLRGQASELLSADG